MNEECLKTVSDFSKLPPTQEKEEIERQYLSDEISPMDFVFRAGAYLEKVSAEHRAVAGG